MRVLRLTLALSLATAFLAACGDGSTSSTSPASSPSPTEVVVPANEWAAGLCGALGDYEATIEQRMTSFKPDTSDLASLKESWKGFLDDMLADTEAVIAEIRALGRPDVADAEAGQEIVTAYSALQASIQELRDAADGLSESDPATFLTEFQASFEGFLTAVEETTAALEDLDEELASAIDSEPSCADL
ncbi:MAG TPA: hypothetical protein VF235_02835 [Actinomycetota bacterium]